MVTCGLLLTLLLVDLSVGVRSTTVYTDSGAVSGIVFTTSQGRTISAFLGVPYAKPPVDSFRFKEPQPIDKWKGILPAHNFSSRCIQYTYHKLQSDPILGDEDCLYLNIFTPIVSSTSKLDVIFYIHGGAFMFGAGDMFTPDYILDYHDIVYVSINYRLGPFGFLSMEDEVIPGNNGLKDQVLALKWVQNNIELFGGDRNKVTITGLSAGGASVHLHYLSPLSRNLFYQGISLSGSAFCPWVLAENSRVKAQILANSVGCPSHDSKILAECLRLRSAKRLLLQMESLFLPWNYNPFSPFGPVVETNSSTAFLTKHPYELMTEGSVKDAPWLTSITTEEGLYPGASFVSNDRLLQDLGENWNRVVPHLLDYNHTVPQRLLNDVSEKIRKFYLGDKNITRENRTEIVKMMSDRLFIADVERAARLQASVTTSPVYFYSFAYRGKYSFSAFLCKCNDDLGASHGDDLLYLIKTSFSLSPLETEGDRDMMNTMVSIWTSFVQSGVPSASPDTVWIPVSPDSADKGNLSYLLISSGKNIKASSSADLSNRKFWDTLPFNELWNAANQKKRYVDEL